MFVCCCFTCLASLAFCLGVTALRADGSVAKRVLDSAALGPNLLKTGGWRPYELGFVQQDGDFVCDNQMDSHAHRGVTYTLELNQDTPQPIVAAAWCQAENVSGTRDGDFAVYLDLVYTDGTPLWGQVASFSTGTHAGEYRQVTVFPEKPVKSVSFYLLLRNHAGRAVFRNPELRAVEAPSGAVVFDTVPIIVENGPCEGLLVPSCMNGIARSFKNTSRSAGKWPRPAGSRRPVRNRAIRVFTWSVLGRDILLYSMTARPIRR